MCWIILLHSQSALKEIYFQEIHFQGVESTSQPCVLDEGAADDGGLIEEVALDASEVLM